MQNNLPDTFTINWVKNDIYGVMNYFTIVFAQKMLQALGLMYLQVAPLCHIITHMGEQRHTLSATSLHNFIISANTVTFLLLFQFFIYTCDLISTPGLDIMSHVSHAFLNMWNNINHMYTKYTRVCVTDFLLLSAKLYHVADITWFSKAV